MEKEFRIYRPFSQIFFDTERKECFVKVEPDEIRKLYYEYYSDYTSKKLLKELPNGYSLQYGLTQKMLEERIEDITDDFLRYRSDGYEYNTALERAFSDNEENWDEDILCPWCGKEMSFGSNIFDYEAYNKDKNSIACCCLGCDEEFEVFFGEDNNIIVKIKKVR